MRRARLGTSRTPPSTPGGCPSRPRLTPSGYSRIPPRLYRGISRDPAGRRPPVLMRGCKAYTPGGELSPGGFRVARFVPALAVCTGSPAPMRGEYPV